MARFSRALLGLTLVASAAAFRTIPFPRGPFTPVKTAMGYGVVASTKTRFNWYTAEVDDVSKFSIVLGPNGCTNHSKTSYVSQYHHCAVAANAGFFGFTPPSCEGNLVVDGKVVLWQRDNWGPFIGFTKSATIVGTITQAQVASLGITSGLSGNVELVRDGRPSAEGVKAGIIDENRRRKQRDPAWVQTDALQVAPRTVFAVKPNGNVFMLVIDGVELFNLGVTIPELAEVLAFQFNATAAVNADGGGSTTYVVDNQIYNRPTTNDRGPIGERAVTSVACIKA